MANPIRLLAVSLLLAAAGCSAVVDPEAKDPLKTAEGFCNSFQDVLSKLDCDVLAQSGGRADPTAADALLISLRGSCDNLQAAVSAGRFSYDGSAAQGCIDALESVGCKGIFVGMMGGPAFPAACARVVKGSVPPGGTCFTWAGQQGGTGFALNECSLGSTCRYNDANVCQSSCGYDSDIGEPCGRGNRNCKSGLYCNYNDYTCYALRGPGATCSNAGTDYLYCDTSYLYCNGSSCQYLPGAGQISITQYPYCNSNSYCPSCNPGTTVCVARTWPGSGVACGGAVQCQDGSFCNSTTGFCSAFSDEGGSCSGGNACGYPPYTSANLYCDSTAICRRYPTGRLGQGGDCYNLGSSYCAEGLFCDTGNVLGLGANTCQPQASSGVCPSFEGCAPGTECRYVPSLANNYCVPLGRLGAACDTNAGTGCLPGTWCNQPNLPNPGVCASLPTAGQPCANSGMIQCAPGLRPIWGATCTCQAYLGDGEPCSGDWDCGSTMTGRRCLSGFCQPFACITPTGWLGGVGGGAT